MQGSSSFTYVGMTKNHTLSMHNATSHVPMYMLMHGHAVINLPSMLHPHAQSCSSQFPSFQCTTRVPSLPLHSSQPPNPQPDSSQHAHSHTVPNLPRYVLHLHAQSGSYESPILSYSYILQFLYSLTSCISWISSLCLLWPSRVTTVHLGSHLCGKLA